MNLAEIGGLFDDSCFAKVGDGAGERPGWFFSLLGVYSCQIVVGGEGFLNNFDSFIAVDVVGVEADGEDGVFRHCWISYLIEWFGWYCRITEFEEK